MSTSVQELVEQLEFWSQRFGVSEQAFRDSVDATATREELKSMRQLSIAILERKAGFEEISYYLLDLQDPERAKRIQAAMMGIMPESRS